jgi:hypothetical protein
MVRLSLHSRLHVLKACPNEATQHRDNRRPLLPRAHRQRAHNIVACGADERGGRLGAIRFGLDS